MWTTPWVMKYERLNFLAITFGRADGLRTVHLTPVPPAAAPPARINAQVAEWFDAIGKAAAALTGTRPRALDPAAVTVRAQRCWNRRAGPLMFAPLAAWVVGILSIRPANGAASPAAWAAAFALTLVLCLALAWFAFGFLKANHALRSGNLDAVTSDDPPEPEAVGAGSSPVRQPRRRWLHGAAVGVMVALMAALLLGVWAVAHWFFPGP